MSAHLPFFTLDDFDLDGKTVLLRVDINCPIDPNTLEILDDTRIREHARTISELSERNAKTVVMAHQGRPGDSDFVSLNKHAELLSKILDKPVQFVEEIFGPTARNAIARLQPGEILLLENLRFCSEEVIEKSPEEQAKTFLVRKLSPLGSLYVNDAFAAAHRSQPSIVGFPMVMPSAAGRVFEKEVSVLTKVLDESSEPRIFVLGGSKISDSVNIIEKLLERNIAHKILLTGLLAMLFLHVQGHGVGRPTEMALERKGLYALSHRVGGLLAKYGDKIVLPVDVAIPSNDERLEYPVGRTPADAPAKDIGSETIALYKEEIAKAKTVIMRGPAGVIEDPLFCKGTEELVKAAAQSKAFTLFGGGHLRVIAEKLGVSDGIDYISTGGGAFLLFISGVSLPAIEALKKSYELFRDTVKGR